MTDPYQTAGAIRRALAAIHDHYDVALHPPVRGGGTGGSGGSKEPPTPVNVDVLDARAATHRDLIHYAQVVLLECQSIEGDTITTRIDAGRIGSLVKFIDVWALQLAEGNPLEAEACARDLAAHASKLRGMALPDRRDWIPLGTCPLVFQLTPDDPDEPCGGQVRAHEGRDPYCVKCGTEGAATWWERVMFPDVETAELVTADELVLVLHRAFGGAPVKPSTLRVWINRGILEKAGTDPEGRSLFSRTAAIYAISRRETTRA